MFIPESPDPDWEHKALPRLLRWIRTAVMRQKGEVMEREKKGKEGEERKRYGKTCGYL